MNTHRIWVALVFLTTALILSSCHPRASRTKPTAQKPATPQQTPPQQAGGVTVPKFTSAKQIMDRTDSVITRVSQVPPEPDVMPMEDETPFASYTPTSPYPPKPDLTAYGIFQSGLAAFNGKQYDEAIGNFSQVVLSGKPAEMVPNAYYWMGESYYAMNRYADCLAYFEYVTKVGPQYKRELSFYKLSRANLKLGNKQGAGLWYERLKNDYPKSTYAKTLAKLGVR